MSAFSSSGGYMGDVDIFGLNEFGDAPDGALPALYGAVAGAGLQATAAAVVRSQTSYGKYSEAIGGGVGAVAGFIMTRFPKSKAAGTTCIAVALTTGVLRMLEAMVWPYSQNTGLVAIEPAQLMDFGRSGRLPTLQSPVVENANARMVGLGMPMVEMRGPDGMPTLVGHELPQIQSSFGLSNHFGATVMG